MLQLKVGIHLASLRQPFKKALLTAAQMGVEAVEIDGRSDFKPRDMTRTAIRQVRKMLEDTNLRVSAVTFQTRRGYNVLEDLDQRVEATKQAMQMAYDFGASVVVNQIGRVPDNAEGSEWDLLVETLGDLGKHAQRVGAFVCARTGSEDTSRLAALIEALPPGCIGVDLDPGNLIINGFSAAVAAKQLGQHIHHVHVRDGVRDLAQGRGLEVPLGRGSVDFPEILGVLEEYGYQGYLTIQRDRAENPILEVNQAVSYLRNL